MSLCVFKGTWGFFGSGTNTWRLCGSGTVRRANTERTVRKEFYPHRSLEIEGMPCREEPHRSPGVGQEAEEAGDPRSWIDGGPRGSSL